jgi:outer membrane protein TolC
MMVKAMKRQKFTALFSIICILLPLVLMACGRVSQESYHRALEKAAAPPEPEYYRVEVSRSIETPPEEDTSDKWTKEFGKLFQMKLEQQACVLELFYDFSSSQSLEYRSLAGNEEIMNARLAESVNLDLLLSLAYERNQGLQAAYRKIEATLEQYPQAAYLDNILSQYNAFTKQLDTKIGKSRHKEMVAMKTPFPEMLTIKGNIVTQDVQLLQKDAEIVLRDLVTDVKLAYWDYLFVDESISITRENQEVIQQMIQIATAKFRAGTANYQSILKAQVALSKLSDMILTQEEKRQMLVAKINTLLSRPPDAPLGAAEPFEYLDVNLSLDELYGLATEHRQEIQKQKIAISKMELMIEMAGKMSTPDASTGNSYFEDRTGISSGTNKMPMTFMKNRTVNPITSAWFARDDAYAREVEVKVDAMQQMIANMEDKTRFMIKMHHFGADTAKRSVALYENTLLPQAQQSLEAAFSAYQAAKVDFINLLDAQRTLLNFSLAKQKALLEHRQHTAQLEQTVGIALPKQALNIDEITP